jgi:YihY family inner membrane protein
MMLKNPDISSVLHRLGGFIVQVFKGFRRNQGLLLSGAVAYYTLLSVVPMLALILVVLSHFIGEQQLYHTVVTHLEIILPNYSEQLAEQVWAFLKHREVVGGVGFLVMLIFSSVAFTVLENAMSVIFFHRVKIHRRHFMVSAIIPYVYILLLAVGALLVSFIAGALETIEEKQLLLFGLQLSLEGSAGIGLYIIGMTGLVLMLTSLYMVMPVGRITFRHALAGGITATVLWEVSRHALVWYFSTLSFVNVIYGSLATAVIALLSIEVASLILLFGAQVIAEFERNILDLAEKGRSGFGT